MITSLFSIHSLQDRLYSRHRETDDLLDLVLLHLQVASKRHTGPWPDDQPEPEPEPRGEAVCAPPYPRYSFGPLSDPEAEARSGSKRHRRKRDGI
jgi:hypothetical protein